MSRPPQDGRICGFAGNINRRWTGMESFPNSSANSFGCFTPQSRGYGYDVAVANPHAFCLAMPATDDSLRFRDISLCRHSGQTIMVEMIRRFDGSALGFAPKSF